MAIRRLRMLGGMALALLLGGCSASGFSIGDRTLTFPWAAPQVPEASTPPIPAMAAIQTFGRGPVKVALLLPLSDPALARAARGMADGAQLAMEFIKSNPNIAENITISLRDSGTTPSNASQAAKAALQAGASLILGPIEADQVIAAGAIARRANVPVIGFAKDSRAAAPGVYLLNVSAEMEARRSVTYALAMGKRGFAGAFAATATGATRAKAFRQALAAVGLSPVAVYTYTNPGEAQAIVQQALPKLKNGSIDTLFLPDRVAAPAFGAALQRAGANGLQIIGSADWDSDGRLAQAPGLTGAIYPGIDPAGLIAITGPYRAQFGAPPPQVATLAYTAAILANVNTLSMRTPRYSARALTSPAGFSGRDGIFRFLANGQGQYGLAIKQIGNGGARVLEGAKL